MLTESEDFALEISKEKNCKFYLYGQEVNPETYAICTSDMLIKGESPENIAFGSTLSKDGFPNQEFDFMLSNPPYGKSWKIDMDFIVGEKKKILDPRFMKGIPRSSDGQLLFLANMAYKMKKRSELGSRVASVHNGSALFTGDAGSGESEMRKWIIENDWLDCIIGLPKNMFYNTGINTYIFILSNKKPSHRKGKVQLIDASEIYQKMRRSLGNKSHELTKEHINQITKLYLDFKETEQSKIFKNEDFGYQKITVERPLRLAAQFSKEAIAALRFHSSLQDEMSWMYKRFGEDVYSDLKKHKELILKHFEKEEISIKPADKKKLLDTKFWTKQKEIKETAEKLHSKIGDQLYNDFNQFKKDIEKAYKKLQLKPDNDTKKQILNAFSWKDETAEKVIKKKEKDGTLIYEPDTDLRDSEQVPLLENIDEYFEREVLPHVRDAWIDYDKTLIGYEISFTRHFYKYQPLRSLDEITKDIMELEKETEGLLKEIVE